LSRTFNRLAELCHYSDLSRMKIEDCLLLLTTCRNEYYTLNAVYVEALQWSREGDTYHGFADALDALRRGFSGLVPLKKAATKAAEILESAARCLDQFDKKYRLFFDRFNEVHNDLVRFGESIPDRSARREFLRYYAQRGSGPAVPHLLWPDPDPRMETYRTRLQDLYAVVRPLTGLARTFLSEVLEIGQSGEKTCADYLAQVMEAARVWKAPYGYLPPDPPPEHVFSYRRSAATESALKESIRLFVSYCADMRGIASTYLREMAGARESNSTQFPLPFPGEHTRISIEGRSFVKVPNMFVLITDMRNSTGEEHRTPQLKVKMSEIVKSLHRDGGVASELTYNDCRAVGCLSLQQCVQSVARLWHSLEAQRSASGFAGLRMGAVRGPMLVDWDGSGRRGEMKILLDDVEQTLATAARIMDLDKRRWKAGSEDGDMLISALGDWSTDESLIFLGASVYEALPNNVQTKCRELGSPEMKGVGHKVCWAVSIPSLAQALL